MEEENVTLNGEQYDNIVSHITNNLPNSGESLIKYCEKILNSFSTFDRNTVRAAMLHTFMFYGIDFIKS